MSSRTVGADKTFRTDCDVPPASQLPTETGSWTLLVLVVTAEHLHPRSAGWRLPGSPCSWLLGPAAGKQRRHKNTMAIRASVDALFLDHSATTTVFYLRDQLMRIK